MYADNEERDLARIVTENYAYLVNHISATELLPYLIERGALSQMDKEEIEAKIVTIDKRGKLIDAVKQRGIRGLRVFLEALEYLEPGVYYHLTKESARSAPDDVKEILRRISSKKKRSSGENFKRMEEFMGAILTKLASNKSYLDSATHCVNTLEDESNDTHQSLMEERENMDHIMEELEESRLRYQQLSYKHMKVLKEVDMLRKKVAAFQRENEDNVTKYHMLDLRRLSLERDHAVWKEMSGEKESTDQLKRIEDKVEALLQANKAAEASRRELENARKTNEKLSHINVEFEASARKALEERKQTLEEKRHYQDRTEELEAQLAKPRDENTAMQSRITLEEKRHYQELSEKLEAQLAKPREENVALQKCTLIVPISFLTLEEKRHYQERTEEMEAQLAKERRMSPYRNTLEEKRHYQERTEELEAQLDKLREENTALARRNSELEERFSTNTLGRNRKSTLEEKRHYQERTEEMEAQLTKDRRMSPYRNTLEEKRHCQDRTEELEAQLAKLREENTALTMRNSELEEETFSTNTLGRNRKSMLQSPVTPKGESGPFFGVFRPRGSCDKQGKEGEKTTGNTRPLTTER